MINNKLKLFSTCLLVIGACRCAIYDIGREKYYLIPSGLAHILKYSQGKTLKHIIKKYHSNRSTILEYFEFLTENELIFWTENVNEFPKLDVLWDDSSKITNAIIDISQYNIDYGSIVKGLENLGCRDIQIRFFEKICIQNFKKLLGNFDGTKFISVEVIAPFSEEILHHFTNGSFDRVSLLVLSQAKKNEEIIMKNNYTKVYLAEQCISDVRGCGVISKNYFSINIPTFTESQQHNTCLNRKISIDKDGYIKNCPSMAHHFGHISDTKLEDVIANPEFTKYWYIKKDEITKCKDCEFRHICTDCRAYRENPDDLYSAPLKCGYDPYTGVWEEWSTNPLKQQAIEHYGMKDLVQKETQA